MGKSKLIWLEEGNALDSLTINPLVSYTVYEMGDMWVFIINL